MIKNNKRFIALNCIFAVFCIAMAVAFLQTLGSAGSVITENRHGTELTKINYVTEHVKDNEASPTGKTRVLNVTLDQNIKLDADLMFYIVHSYVRVYLEDELIYERKPSGNTQLGRTPGFNWVLIPLTSADSGKRFRVELDPVYEFALNEPVIFLQGTEINLIKTTLREDSLQISLSIIAMGVGIFYAILAVWHKLKNKNAGWYGHLAVVAFLLGCWKLMDTRIMALLFPLHAKMLINVIYLSLMLLPLSIILLLMERMKRDLTIFLAASFCALLDAYIMIQQLLRIRDLRENLILIHIQIAVGALTLLYASFRLARKKDASRLDHSIGIGFILFIFGGIGDLIHYYMIGDSFNALGALCMILVYVVISGIIYAIDLNRKANIDAATGVANKTRCLELLESGVPDRAHCVTGMLDVNGLKRVNDTQGHEMGDVLIASVANVLKKTLPADAFIGRYGGDEFLVIFAENTKVTKDSVEKALKEAMEAWNRDETRGEKERQITMSFSMGMARADDYGEGTTLMELAEFADAKMYDNKKKYYETHEQYRKEE